MTLEHVCQTVNGHFVFRTHFQLLFMLIIRDIRHNIIGHIIVHGACQTECRTECHFRVTERTVLYFSFLVCVKAGERRHANSPGCRYNVPFINVPRVLLCLQPNALWTR